MLSSLKSLITLFRIFKLPFAVLWFASSPAFDLVSFKWSIHTDGRGCWSYWRVSFRTNHLSELVQVYVQQRLGVLQGGFIKGFLSFNIHVYKMIFNFIL